MRPDCATGRELRAGSEKRMRNQVEAIVSSVVGAGRDCGGVTLP